MESRFNVDQFRLDIKYTAVENYRIYEFTLSVQHASIFANSRYIYIYVYIFEGMIERWFSLDSVRERGIIREEGVIEVLIFGNWCTRGMHTSRKSGSDFSGQKQVERQTS